VTKQLYGGPGEGPPDQLATKKQELARLEEQQREERERALASNQVPRGVYSLQTSFIMYHQVIWQNAYLVVVVSAEEEEREEEEEEEGPPPLPTRDYGAPPPLLSLLDPAEGVMARSIYLEVSHRSESHSD
jgi:hypothetical protein